MKAKLGDQRRTLLVLLVLLAGLCAVLLLGAAAAMLPGQQVSRPAVAPRGGAPSFGMGPASGVPAGPSAPAGAPGLAHPASSAGPGAVAGGTNAPPTPSSFGTSLSPNARIYRMVSALTHRRGKATFGFGTSAALREIVQAEGSQKRYTYAVESAAGYLLGSSEPVVLEPRAPEFLPTIRLQRDIATQAVQVTGSKGISSFCNDLFVPLAARTGPGQWTETVKLFDLVEDRGFFPPGCTVRFETKAVQLQNRRCLAVAYASSPFAARLIHSSQSTVRCHFQGLAVFEDEGKGPLVCAAYSFRAEGVGQADNEAFEERYLILQEPNSGEPADPIGQDKDLVEALDAVLPERPVSGPFTDAPMTGLSQLCLISRTAYISSGYVAEQRSNPLPILAIIGAIYLADFVGEIVTDVWNDGKLNGNGVDLTKTFWRTGFHGLADAFGLDPKYDKYVDVAADIVDFGVGMATCPLKGHGAIKTIPGPLGLKATSIHYSLWAHMRHGAAWAEQASKGLKYLDMARYVKRASEVRDLLDIGQSFAKAVGSEKGQSVVILLDTSGSMADKAASGEVKMEAAQRSAKEALGNVAPGQPIEWALFTFQGSDPHLAVTFRSDTSELIRIVSEAKPSGNTPLAKTMRAAGDYARSNARFGQIRMIILSDGEDTCGGNPVEEAGRLSQQHIQVNQRHEAPGGPGGPLLALADELQTVPHAWFAAGPAAAVGGRPGRIATDATPLLAQVLAQSAASQPGSPPNRPLAPIRITVIGFDVKGSPGEQQLMAIAAAGNGDYLPVDKVSDLSSVLRVAMERSGVSLVGGDPTDQWVPRRFEHAASVAQAQDRNVLLFVLLGSVVGLLLCVPLIVLASRLAHRPASRYVR